MKEKTVLLPEQRELIALAQRLELDGVVDELYEQFGSPEMYTDMTFEDKLKRCLESHEEHVAHKRFNKLFRNSRVRKRIYLKQFAPDPSRGFESTMLLKLKDCDYNNKGINIVISGASGTGKTALACAAAVEAMSKGYSVMFYRFNDFMTMVNSKDGPSFIRFRDRIKNIDLIVFDDWGLSKIPDNIVCALNEIAECRYGIGSTIITSQLGKNSLKKVIDPSPIRDALADRLMRDSDMEITLKGASWRGTNEEIKGEQND